jgi:Domain of unknown function (DUF4832)/Beta-galactosidase
MISRILFIVLLTQWAFGETLNLSSHWDSTRILENPHKGWYHHSPDNQTNRYHVGADSELDNFPGLDHIFVRMSWAWFEPVEGKYNWTWIDTMVNRWVPKGYRIGIAITTKENDLQYATPTPGYATPKWVFDAGAKASLQNGGFWEPDFNDPIFLEKLNKFHAALAKRYGDKPWLSYVQMASYGTWGEGHNWPASNTKYPFSTLKKHLDIYLNNYPGVKICLSDDAYSEGVIQTERELLKQYVEEKGIFWTDHSILVEYHTSAFPATFSIKTPALFADTWKTRPAQLELEHYHKIKGSRWSVPNGVQKGQSLLRGAIDLAHATYVGYHGDAKTWFADNPSITRDLVNRIGYWFFPTTLVLPQKLTAGTTQSIQMSWNNRGVAPAYNRYLLKAKLQNKTFTHTQVFMETNTASWMPGIAQIENYSLKLPSGIPPGMYDFSVALVLDTLPNSQKIELALVETIKDSAGFYNLAKVEVSQGSPGALKGTLKHQSKKKAGTPYLPNGKKLSKEKTTNKNIPVMIKDN